MDKNFIVIGAGLSGLNIARKIHHSGLGSVKVIEKSRGVGGRMATRRTLQTRFDHGAQFYRLKNDILELHQEWFKNNITHQWFRSSLGEHWSAKTGMTAFAKNMQIDLDVELEKEIRTIHFEDNKWKLISKTDDEWSCEHLIISSPLPQTVNLLSELEKGNKLNSAQFSVIKSIQYTKALIALVTLENNSPLEGSGYLEFDHGDFFSISDQHKKGLSELPALTVTMSADFSEKEFENDDKETLDKILVLLNSHYPQLKISGAELKKWRYCKPVNQYQSLFLEIAPKLFLIGDAFGGSSLLGAVRSSQALFESLTEKKI